MSYTNPGRYSPSHSHAAVFAARIQATAQRAPRAWAAAYLAAWVVGGAAALAVLAQVSIPLWFTPVPLSLATLGVWGLALTGGLPGVGAVGLYAVAGALGLPVLAGGAHGIGVTFGYVVGYVVAAALVVAIRAAGARRRREHGADADGTTNRARRWHATGVGLAAVAAGTVAVYVCGAAWLAAATGMDAAEAVAVGVAPFLVGDVIKLAAGGVLAGLTAR